METIQRRPARPVFVGNVQVGGGAPISVQSMTNTLTCDIDATVEQIRRLESVGCEIIRVAVPDQKSADAIREIKQQITIPLIADIHFDHRLAVASAKAGADCLRINPGNIGPVGRVQKIVDCAKDLNISIRIGVNAGSLEKDLLKQYSGATAEAMVESALRQINLMESLQFDALKISLKASDVKRTVSAYRLLAEKTDIPFHVGVTEAGTLYSGIVKSSLGIGMLLAAGVGDTIRVSLTRDPADEVRTGFEILKALDIRRRGPELISCPTCGRCEINLFEIVEQIEKALMTKTVPIKIAVMGCVVNGPGEAREADIGVAGGRDIGILFKNGKVVRKIPGENLVETLLDEIAKYETDQNGSE